MIETSRIDMLGRGQIWLRAGTVSVIGIFLAIMHGIQPERLSSWIPLRTSCGALTGLPCLFCGTTRALHALTNAEFSRALYFNWLAFPLLGALIFVTALFGAEVILRRPLFAFAFRWQITGRSASVAILLISALWLLQVYLAVSQHKTELINPSGLLYALFVR